MGVPFLFAVLKKQYPYCVTMSSSKECDSLFLDWNGGIHVACREVAENPSFEALDQKSLEHHMIERILADLRTVIRGANPKRTLYVAIDGVAPSAKISHQRKRRYKTAKDNTIMQEIRQQYDIPLKKRKWDSNAITPGTRFMMAVCTALKNELHQSSAYKHLRVIFSDAYTAGEGEQKIANFMRASKADDLGVCWIHGLDADFIFLTLLMNHLEVMMWRDDSKKPCYLDIASLRTCLITTFGEGKDADADVIRDIVMLSNLLGNDFLPGLTCLPIFPNGFDILFDCYKRQSRALVDHMGILRIEVFVSILQELNTLESSLIQRRSQRWQSAPCLDAMTFEDSVQNYEKNLPRPLDTVASSHKGWIQRYHALHGMKHFKIPRMIQDYMYGMQWMLDYYTGKPITWKWFYTYNGAPLVFDLLQHVSSFKMVPMDVGRPLPSMVQLMCVLPPQSYDLLPESIRSIMLSPSLQNLCPTTFEELSWCKEKRHETVPLLPPLKIGLMMQSYIEFEKAQQKKTKY